ncbi:23926_t:CDS:1, partial [Dentiscutata erythropus]
MVTKGDTVGLVEKLLNRAEYLIDNSISKEYKRRLLKAWKVFDSFAHWVGLAPYLASRELLVAFLAWMELLDRSTEIQACLAVVAREHKVKGFKDPTKGSSVCLVVEGIKRSVAQEKVK